MLGKPWNRTKSAINQSCIGWEVTRSTEVWHWRFGGLTSPNHKAHGLRMQHSGSTHAYHACRLHSVPGTKIKANTHRFCEAALGFVYILPLTRLELTDISSQ